MNARGFLAIALALALAACAGAKKNAEAPELAPAKPEAVRSMARGVEAARAAEGRDEAIGHFERALKADSELWEARYNLGILRAESGDLARAERELAAAQTLAPDAEDVAVALAEVRRRRRDPEGAVQALESFVTRHPGAPVAPTALVAALREANRLDRAIDLAHRILVRKARDPYTLAELALAHLERGELDTAQILADEAAKSDPKSAIAARTLGLIALRKGDDALAFRHFSRASELDPKDTTARLNMGSVLLQAGVYDRAVKEFSAVLNADPDDIPAMLGLAAARRGLSKRDDQGALQEVEKLLRRVLEKEPANLAATFNLAVLYADHLKRPAEAAPLYRRFLDEAPKEHPARAEAEKFLASQK